jgi:insulysin
MINNFQYFDIDISINDKRDVRGLILHNKIKVVLISDKDINRSICSVGVGAGYLQDIFEGTAHFLEHLLFMGSEKYPKQNDYTSYIQTCGGTYNAFTADNMTVYYLELDSSFFKKGV